MATRTRRGQFKRQTRRRISKYKKAVNIPNAVVGLVGANALSTVLFDTDLRTFLFERWDGTWTARSDNSWEITLAALLNVGGIKNMGMASNYSLGKAVSYNLKTNWPKAVGSVLIAGFANSVAKKMGVYRMLNRTVRTVGAGKLLKF